MDSLIYLDNAATTKVAPEVAELMSRCFLEEFGNPSSVHLLGVAARHLVEESRKTMARCLFCRPAEIVFTGGGSEADNLAVLGAAAATRRRTLVVSAVEHPAVLEAARELANRGCTVKLAPVDRYGMVEEEKLLALVDEDTFLVSVMLANNEVGTVQPVKQLARAVKRAYPHVLFHTDAVQAFTRLPIDLSDGVIDLLAVAAHKIHGPKGVGALYVKSGTKVRPLVFGGGQERGLRAGTENVAGIAGFARAAELALEGQAEHCRRMSEARAAVLAVLREGIAGLTVNGHPTVRLPNVLHVGIPGVRSQNLVHFLEEAGVLVSAGAACHSTREKQSHVAAAMGLPADAAVLRVSVSRYTTAEEACEGARRIVAVVERLRR